MIKLSHCTFPEQTGWAEYTYAGYGNLYQCQIVGFGGLKFHESIWTDPYSYLNQGPAFDKFGNKSVKNGKFDGTLFPTLLAKNGGAAQIPEWVTVHTGGDFIVHPAIYRRGFCLLASRMVNLVSFTDARYSYIIATAPCFDTSSRQAVWAAYQIQIWGNGYTYPSIGNGGPSTQSSLDQEVRSIFTELLRSTDPRKSRQEQLEYLLGHSTTIVGLTEHAASLVQQYYSGNPDRIYGRSLLSTNQYSESDVNVDSLKSDILPIYAKIATNTHFWDDEKLSDLGAQVIDNINDFASNSLAYFSDIASIGDSIRSVLSLVADPQDPKKWASAWLSLRFSDRLTIQDTRELLCSLRDALFERQYWTLGRSRISYEENFSFGSLVHERTATVIVDNNYDTSLMHHIDALMRWDAWPTLENTWDLIPLSFVVDWFLPVSDILDRVDKYVQVPYLVPLTQYVGDKVTFTFNSVPGCTGTLKYTLYERFQAPVLSWVKPFRATLTSIPSFGVINIGDSLALAVQYRMR